MVALTELQIDDTEVTDLTPLASCKNLERLSIRNTPVTDISPLKNAKKLKYLYIEGAPVSDTTVLEPERAEDRPQGTDVSCALNPPPSPLPASREGVSCVAFFTTAVENRVERDSPPLLAGEGLGVGLERSRRFSPRDPQAARVSRSHQARAVLRRLREDAPRRVDARLRAVREGDLVDVGCGDKPYEALFAPKVSKYVGIEYNETYGTSFYKQHNPKADITYSGDRLPFGDASFDTVLSNQVGEHVPHPEAFFAELARVLRPGALHLHGPVSRTASTPTRTTSTASPSTPSGSTRATRDWTWCASIPEAGSGRSSAKLTSHMALHWARMNSDIQELGEFGYESRRRGSRGTGRCRTGFSRFGAAAVTKVLDRVDYDESETIGDMSSRRSRQRRRLRAPSIAPRQRTTPTPPTKALRLSPLRCTCTTPPPSTPDSPSPSPPRPPRRSQSLRRPHPRRRRSPRPPPARRSPLVLAAVGQRDGHAAARRTRLPWLARVSARSTRGIRRPSPTCM